MNKAWLTAVNIVVIKNNRDPRINHASRTDCSEQALLFPELISRKTVTVDFNGGHVSSDGGGVLLARLDRSYGYVKRFERCFTDHRDPELVEHSLLELLRQRVYGLALGYEDLNDHDRLCQDPLLAALCGKSDPLGQDRERVENKGKALAGKSTLNRLELTPANATAKSRYKKIVARPQDIEEFFIREYVRSLGKETTEVVLDLDRTDDPLHGEQEGRHFNAYYREYCYTPLYIFDGHWPVVAALHTADGEHLDETIRLLGLIVRSLRERLPNLRIIIRGDSGFCRPELMVWCEQNNVHYVLAMRRNKALERILRATLRSVQALQERHQSERERLYKDFRYAARTWGPKRKRPRRRVVGKAECNREGPGARFVITNLKREQWAAQALYEQLYCARGDMENRIKEQQLDLYADRTSTETLRANQLRLWFSTLAYLLMNQLRRVGLAGTELAKATCGTIRTRLLKIGAVITVTVRRVWVHLSSAFPLQELISVVARQIKPLEDSG